MKDLNFEKKKEFIKAQKLLAEIMEVYGLCLIATTVNGKGMNKDKTYPVIGFQTADGTLTYTSRRCHFTGMDLEVDIKGQIKKAEKESIDNLKNELEQARELLKSCQEYIEDVPVLREGVRKEVVKLDKEGE